MADEKVTETQEFKDALKTAVADSEKALRSNRDDILAEKKKTEQRLRDIEAKFDGIDLDEVKALKAKQEAADKAKITDAGEWDKLEAKLVEKHAAETSKINDRAAKLMAALERELIDGQATRAIAEAEGSVPLLLPHVRGSMKVVESDGKFQAVIVDGLGETVLAPDAKSGADLMTPGQYVSSLKGEDAFQGAFKGTGMGGSGASTSDRGGVPKGGTISGNDPLEFGRNLHAIAKGDVKVVMEE